MWLSLHTLLSSPLQSLPLEKCVFLDICDCVSVRVCVVFAYHSLDQPIDFSWQSVEISFEFPKRSISLKLQENPQDNKPREHNSQTKPEPFHEHSFKTNTGVNFPGEQLQVM